MITLLRVVGLLILVSAQANAVSAFASPKASAAGAQYTHLLAKRASPSSAVQFPFIGSHVQTRSRRRVNALFASEGDDANTSSSPPSKPLFDTNPDATKEDWSDFNPFQPVPSSTGASTTSSIASPGQPLSLRAIRMKSITSDLYRHNANPTKMDEILSNNVDFLIEQLVDLEAVMDVDSIYTADMDLEARRDKYKEVMDQRVAQAKSGEVKRVLVRLRDFVLEKCRGGNAVSEED